MPERGLRQNCDGETFVTVAINVSSFRRIFMPAFRVRFNLERIL
jgi:hypothetical protein